MRSCLGGWTSRIRTPGPVCQLWSVTTHPCAAVRHEPGGTAQSLRAAVVAALLRMLEEPPDEVAPRVPGLLADMATRYPPLQRRAIDGGALEALADILHLGEPCDELLVRRRAGVLPCLRYEQVRTFDLLILTQRGHCTCKNGGQQTGCRQVSSSYG